MISKVLSPSTVVIENRDHRQKVVNAELIKRAAVDVDAEVSSQGECETEYAQEQMNHLEMEIIKEDRCLQAPYTLRDQLLAFALAHPHALPIWRLQPGLQKPIDEISDGSAPPAFLLGIVRDRAMTCNTLLEICSYLQAPQCDWSTVSLFFFFLFFLLSIAQRIRSKPPPSHIKVLSFVRDVRTFGMTPYVYPSRKKCFRLH